MSQPDKPYVYAVSPEVAPCSDTPVRRARKLKVQLARHRKNQAFEKDVANLVNAARDEQKEARDSLAERKGTVPGTPESIALKERQVAEAEARLAAADHRVGMLHGDFADNDVPTPTAPAELAHSDAVGWAASNAPLTTGGIAHSFDGLKWTEAAWKKSLGYPPKWLTSCRVSVGRRGVVEALWNPVLVGAALVLRDGVPTRKVRARFQTKPALKPWSEDWKDHEATHFSDG